MTLSTLVWPSSHYVHLRVTLENFVRIWIIQTVIMINSTACCGPRLWFSNINVTSDCPLLANDDLSSSKEMSTEGDANLWIWITSGELGLLYRSVRVPPSGQIVQWKMYFVCHMDNVWLGNLEWAMILYSQKHILENNCKMILLK